MPQDDEKPAEPIAIPHGELSPDALRGVAESVVLREGTDYGEREMAFEIKVSQLLEKIARGEAQIYFDPGSESIDIVPVVIGIKDLG